MHGGGQREEGGGVEPQGEPFGEDFGAEGFVELERGVVPLEGAPLETGATGGMCVAGGGGEKFAAETAFAERRAHVEIFEERTGLAEESGERGIPDGEAGGGVLIKREDSAGVRGGPEQVLRQKRARDFALVVEALEGGEFADQCDENGNIREGGGPEVKAAARGSLAAAAAARTGRAWR